LKRIHGVIGGIMEIPACDIEVSQASSETGAIGIATERAIHMRCIGAFNEVGEVSRLVAELTEVGDVSLEVVADQDNVAFRD
jgi:hypothetical protein